MLYLFLVAGMVAIHVKNSSLNLLVGAVAVKICESKLNRMYLIA